MNADWYCSNNKEKEKKTPSLIIRYEVTVLSVITTLAAGQSTEQQRAFGTLSAVFSHLYNSGFTQQGQQWYLHVNTVQASPVYGII